MLQAAAVPPPSADADTDSGGGGGGGSWPGWGAWHESRLPRALGLMLCHVRYGHAESCGFVLRTGAQLQTVERRHGRALGILAEQSGAHALLVARRADGEGARAAGGRGLLLLFGHRWAARKARALVEQWLRREQTAAAAGLSPTVSLRTPIATRD
ncbi:hypothetical protein T492DRAFT_1059573 [Pavlovales sp. CCMP2436]|nr:hypothetical protein T492DRAFT_1059573 [Pavlovales sp. CCMP2436]